ncbi:hypothetical protein CYL18_06270 [Pradoshia eiseniae]|uniref:Uncharacterized protein n=1 Tax=Pradoshia eiseniae TaxID=2064768 RepID=A0A2S7N2J6_9BACI|nr:hypothetical protein [Pradoshia eiseniae]PQD96200.1 hypothetical protein CYL18_06270 [Pradoshia eiseniae]
MNLKATILGAVGVTAVAGTLIFNTDAAEKVMNNIEALKSKIQEFAQNDAALVEKYNKLREDAQTKIAELEEQLKNNTTSSDAEKAELQAEIARLEGQLKLANAAIEGLEIQSNKAVEVANSYTMTSADSLPGLDGEIVAEEKIATAKAHFYAGHTQVDITPKEDINLGLLSSKGNIVVKFIDANGDTVQTKNKSWAGYLNDSQGNKYGKGTNVPSNNYSNDLKAGKTYTTTLNKDNVAKVIVTVTTNNNEVKTIELTK